MTYKQKYIELQLGGSITPYGNYFANKSLYDVVRMYMDDLIVCE
uniref:Uncharacterized protein n=1 Tax=Megaviridae environmental sample TaxID=1737588 RepID=A0A5J6VJ58_9VIRU|nr:MAG: hypothetical protein [Megaviridae environmental sample]